MKRHPKMDCALAAQLNGQSNDTLEALADIYARWARQLRAFVKYQREYDEGSLSAGEKRYCEVEGIPADEYLKRKEGKAR